MRPPALERDGTAVPYVAYRTFKAAFHNFGGLGKGHTFGEPADLGRVDPKEGNTTRPVSRISPAIRRVSSKTFA